MTPYIAPFHHGRGEGGPRFKVERVAFVKQIGVSMSYSDIWLAGYPLNTRFPTELEEVRSMVSWKAADVVVDRLDQTLLYCLIKAFLVGFPKADGVVVRMRFEERHQGTGGVLCVLIPVLIIGLTLEGNGEKIVVVDVDGGPVVIVEGLTVNGRQSMWFCCWCHYWHIQEIQ